MKPKDNGTSLDSLPGDVHALIFSHLPPSDKQSLAGTSKALRKHYSDMPLWERAGAKDEADFNSRMQTLPAELQNFVNAQRVRLPIAEQINPHFGQLSQKGKRKILALMMMEMITPKDFELLTSINGYVVINMLAGEMSGCRNAARKREYEQEHPKPVLAADNVQAWLDHDAQMHTTLGLTVNQDLLTVVSGYQKALSNPDVIYVIQKLMEYIRIHKDLPKLLGTGCSLPEDLHKYAEFRLKKRDVPSSSRPRSP